MAALPNFLLVGAARSGTTSLVRYLSQHPDIFMAQEKEVNYFSSQHFPTSGPGDEVVNRVVIRDSAVYASMFAPATAEHAVGESSVFYLYYEDVPRRIRREIPGARILVQLREPSSRALSAYLYLLRHERESLPFEEALQAEDERKRQQWEPLWYYKALSRYSEQIKRYFDVFGRERVKVVLYEDMAERPEAVFRDIFHFLGVDQDFRVDTSVRHNVSGVPVIGSGLYYTLFMKKDGLVGSIRSHLPRQVRSALGARTRAALVRPGQMVPQTQEYLSAYFADDIAELEDLLQRDLRIWKTPGVVSQE